MIVFCPKFKLGHWFLSTSFSVWCVKKPQKNPSGFCLECRCRSTSFFGDQINNISVRTVHIQACLDTAGPLKVSDEKSLTLSYNNIFRASAPLAVTLCPGYNCPSLAWLEQLSELSDRSFFLLRNNLRVRSFVSFSSWIPDRFAGLDIARRFTQTWHSLSEWLTAETLHFIMT